MNKIKDAQSLVDRMLEEASKEVKVSDVPDDKKEIFKINRAKAGIKGAALTKAEKGGERIKESDQVKTAQQSDTLFDDTEGMVKDSGDLDPSLNPEPNTESTSINLAKVIAAQNKLSQEKKNKSVNKESVKNDPVVEGLVDWVKKKREAVQSGKVKKGGLMGALSARQKAMKDAMAGN